MLYIAADKQIPFVEDACAGLGLVTAFSATDAEGLKRALGQADALLCRSTIRVDEALLRDTPVRFVATATSGTEHLDMEFLDRAGITHASAAGSNARSVAEYVFTALFELGLQKDFDPAARSIGIVGAGHVGREVESIARAIGMEVVLCDPPLLEVTGDTVRYRSLEEALLADVVSVHVPLTRTGPCPTFGMCGEEFFSGMKPGSVFFNTARGGVLRPEAYFEARARGILSAAVFDVFPREPDFDPALLAATELVTPHIAGHSLDGKILGTQMVYEALSAFQGASPWWTWLDYMPDNPVLKPEIPTDSSAAEEILTVIRTAFDIRVDDLALREAGQLEAGERPGCFSRLRADYRVRREFHRCSLPAEGLSSAAADVLSKLGFNLT